MRRLAHVVGGETEEKDDTDRDRRPVTGEARLDVDTQPDAAEPGAERAKPADERPQTGFARATVSR